MVRIRAIQLSNLIGLHRSIAAVVLALFISSGIILAAHLFPAFLASWEATTYDARLRMIGPAEASADLVIIGRDSESDAGFGTGIWDRAKFAKVITGLGRAGAAIIVSDFHFAGESPAERGGKASDVQLAEATRMAGNVIYPVPARISSSAPSGDPLNPALATLLQRTMPIVEESVRRNIPAVQLLSSPSPALLEGARGAGHIAALPDSDGVYRRVPIFVDAAGTSIEALGLAAVAAYLHVPAERLRVNHGTSVELRDARWPDGRQHTLRLPIDDHGQLLIPYAGRWADGRFSYFSFMDVWDAIEEGRDAELREQVQGKIVLLMHASLESDKRRTPLEVGAPGGFVHANLMNALLMEQAFRTLPWWSNALIVLGMGIGGALFILIARGWRGVGATLLLGLVYLGVSVVALSGAAVVLPTILPLVALVVSFGAGLVWSYGVAEGRAQDLERAQLELQRALAAKHELLMHQETRAEQLEEDLEEARHTQQATQTEAATLEQSLASLREQLTAAQRETDDTRATIATLNGKLAALRAAHIDRSPLAFVEQEQLRQECARFGIVTRDAVLLRVWKDLTRVARSRMPVLIVGEPGTGKELFAKAAHQLSERAASPFVPVNMAAIPADLFESELFGHLRGSFTGAVRDHDGFFLQAHTGTIFLDEIGDLRPDLQAKLLRVLQESVVTRVGDRKAIAVDVRIVSATNRDLLRGIAEGWFREDLYYRLHGIELRLPPLRERDGDVPELAQRFIDAFAAKEGRSPISISQGALERLNRWPWKGNVRELKRCVENAVVLAEGPMIIEEDLRLSGPVAEQVSPSAPPAGAPSKGTGDPKKSDTALLQLLREHSFDLQATAATLGWDRSTVMQRVKGMCFQALADHQGNRRAAATALAGEQGLVRLIEAKITEYADHLKTTAASYPTEDEAIVGIRKRMKNLPERYFAAVETLIRKGLIAM